MRVLFKFLSVVPVVFSKRCASSKVQKLNDLLIKMPKLKNIQGAQEVRAAVLKNKAKRGGYEPSEITLHILGPGSVGGCRALVLASDSIAYLFNCGEGTQRLITEHKIKLVKLEQIFLTSNCWDNFGGLPGLAITAADIGIPDLSVHGPPDCERLVLETQGFVNIDEMTIFKKDCWSPNDFSDEILTVKSVPLFGPKKCEDRCVPSPFAESNYYENRGNAKKGRIRLLSESEGEALEPDMKRPKVPDMPGHMKAREVALAYIVKTRAKLGTLLLDRCVDLGVPKGPLLGKLKNNIPVTLANGRVIDPKQVRSPDDPGKTFVVVDCPSVDFLDSLCDENAKTFGVHFRDGAAEDHPAVVVHFTPVSVMRNERYRKWVSNFPDGTCHLLLNEEVPCSGAVDVHRMQTKLHVLDEVFFPLLKEEYPEVKDADGGGDDCYSWMRSKSALPDCKTAWVGYPGVKFRLRARRNEPTNGLDRRGFHRIKRQEYKDEVHAFPEAPKLIAEARESIAAIREKQENHGPEYPQILFLGTGSAIPNKSRNTSGILISKSENSRMILDCGEGTLGQLVRFFSFPLAWEVLRQVDAIYVSHLHADHHIGLIGLLRARKQAFSAANNPENAPFKPVTLIAPPGLKKFLEWYSAVFQDLEDTYDHFDSRVFMKTEEGVFDDVEAVEKVKSHLNLARLETCYVPHCYHAFGVIVKPKNGLSVVYSGDCRPSDALVKLGLGEDGEGPDILIHEATVEDDLAEDAVMKRHCTASEALDVARRMKAKRVLFTHFSQRYKIPVLSDEVAGSVGVAFDNMTIKPRDFEILPLLYRPLRAMFAEHVGDMEAKTQKYVQRREASVES